MSTPSPEERIKELARKSAIDPAAADRLLAAVRLDAMTEARGWNPFERWSSGTCVAIGTAASLASLGMTRLSFRFAGFLDQQVTGGKAVGWMTAFIDLLGAFPLGALAFWLVGVLLARQTRFIDMLATVGLARVPAMLLAIPMALVARGKEPEELRGVLLALASIGLVGVGLQITCLVLGFRTATGLRGTRLVLGVLGALAISEVSSLVLRGYH